MCAMSGTKGSSGFGSHSKEHMDNKTKRKGETDVSDLGFFEECQK